MHILAFGQSDVGCQRTHNEDAYLIDPLLGLYMVCDGLGGHMAGEIASHQAVQVIQEVLRQHIARVNAYIKTPSAEGRTAVLQLLNHAIQAANAHIYTLAQDDGSKHGMGTTLALLLVLGEAVVIAHVGDSRVYLIRDRQAYQLTKDHSLVGELLKQHTLSKAEVADFPYTHIMTRCLGQHPTVQAATLFVECMAQDRFLLCSDGFHRMLNSDAELAELSDFFTADSLPEAYITLAKERGGTDNSTVIIAQVEAVDTVALETRIAGHYKVELLKRIRLFQACDYHELVKLISITQERTYQPGDSIIEEDTRGDDFFILLAGTVQVLKQNQVILTLGAGGHFGEMGLVEELTRTATIKALDTTRVIQMHRDDFYRLLEHEPQLAVKMLQSFITVLNQRLRVTTTELMEARQAVAHLIQDMARPSDTTAVLS